jgi:hypothetical protein
MTQTLYAHMNKIKIKKSTRSCSVSDAESPGGQALPPSEAWKAGLLGPGGPQRCSPARPGSAWTLRRSHRLLLKRCPHLHSTGDTSGWWRVQETRQTLQSGRSFPTPSAPTSPLHFNRKFHTLYGVYPLHLGTLHLRCQGPQTLRPLTRAPALSRRPVGFCGITGAIAIPPETFSRPRFSPSGGK